MKNRFDSVISSPAKECSTLRWLFGLLRRRAPRNDALCLLAYVFLAQVPASAGEWPVATRTIYPRDLITAEMIEDRTMQLRAGTAGAYIENKNEIIGKVARQTLLKGALIPVYAVETPRLVTNGGQVRIIFRASGLVIVTYGAAMQDGTAGELVRVRNSDSGLIVSGTVQPDGSVLVGEG